MKILTLLILLSSCVTSDPELAKADNREEISALTGSSADFVIEQWGKADQEILKGDKRTLKFMNVRFNNKDIINREVTVESCTVWIESDSKGIITSWDKTDCKD